MMATKSKPQKYKDKSESRRISNANLVMFKPGYDPRRNYHGRPKDHDELRELIRDVAAELSHDKKYSRIYHKITAMFDSRDPRDSIAVIEHGWGKVPDRVEIDDGSFKKYQDALQALLGTKEKDVKDSNSGGSQ